MEMLLNVLGYPFTWGLLVGLGFAAWAFFGGWSARRAFRREVRRLEAQCSAAAESNARGTKALLDENADLKRKVGELESANGNLRVSLSTMENKPGRAELKQLYLLDTAVHLMYARAPGFAPAWEGILKEAQDELDKTSTGLLPLLRRIVHPLPSAGGPGKEPVALPGPPRE